MLPEPNPLEKRKHKGGVMTILITALIVLILGIVLIWIANSDGIIGLSLCVISGMFLFVALIVLPIERYSTHVRILEFKVARASIETARKSSTIENAAMQLKIIDENQWLTRKKYWNNTVFDIWIPDEIEKLDLIK